MVTSAIYIKRKILKNKKMVDKENNKKLNKTEDFIYSYNELLES